MKPVEYLFSLIMLLFTLSTLSGCETMAVHKRIPSDAKTSFKNVGVVVSLPDLIASYKVVGRPYEPLRSHTAFAIDPGVIEASVVEAVRGRLESGSNVVLIPTSADEKSMMWTNLEGLTFIPRKKALMDRMSAIAREKNLDAVILVRRSDIKSAAMGHNFAGLIHTYRPFPNRDGGDHGLLVSMAVDVLDGKSLDSVSTQFVGEKSTLGETTSRWTIPISRTEISEASRLIAKEVGQLVARALYQKGL